MLKVYGILPNGKVVTVTTDEESAKELAGAMFEAGIVKVTSVTI